MKKSVFISFSRKKLKNMEDLEKLLELIKDCNDLNGVEIDVDKLIETLELC